MKVISLFSGIGAPEKALKNLGVPLELIAFSEIDKYAVKSYCAIHGVDESLNLGDITKVDATQLPKDIDLITYGFPCQDISLAGKQKGLLNEDGSQTRSGLFFEALRIIETAQPKAAIAENVKNLIGKKFKPQFELVLKSLEDAGYNNYWKVLNAKDFGIPQNRERVFIVSIRKDIDNGTFEFPKGFPLELRLKDVLEDDVDEKFYIKTKGMEGLIRAMTDGRGHKPNIMDRLTDCCSTIDTKVGDQTHRSPYIVASRGRNPNNLSDRTAGRPTEQRLEINTQEVCNTLTTVQKDNYVAEPGEKLRIRKLTPKECWRLMGFEDEDFAKAEAVNSNTQLYKQAGNSIVVDVFEHLIKGVLDMNLWTDNPVLDAERYYEDTEPKKIGVCEHCSDPIYENEDYYDIHGDMIHEDCLREWADEQYKVS